MLLPMYPTLGSHKELVSGARNQALVCMARAMHFWSHQFGETPQRIYFNKGEAKMVVALARWLVTEGEDPEKIKVLAAYNGQVSDLRNGVLSSLRDHSSNISSNRVNFFHKATALISNLSYDTPQIRMDRQSAILVRDSCKIGHSLLLPSNCKLQ